MFIFTVKLYHSTDSLQIHILPRKKRILYTMRHMFISIDQTISYFIDVLSLNDLEKMI